MERSYGCMMKPTESDINNFIYLNAYGFITDSPNFSIQRECFSDYLLMACLSGILHIEQYGKKAVLTEGSCCLMNLNDYHYYYSDKYNACKILWLHLGGHPLNDLLPFLLPKQEFNIFEHPQLACLIEKTISIAKEDIHNGELWISSTLYEILIHIISVSKEYSNQEETPPHWFTKNMDEYIANHLSEKLTTERLAQYFHLNTSYFCRKVKQTTGITPMQYVLHKKIQIAKYKLSYTDEKISTISSTLGFCDQNHFSSSFYKVTRQYPSIYRKQQK